MPSSKKVAVKTFSQICTSVVSWSLLVPWPDKHLLREETDYTHSAQGQESMENDRDFSTWNHRSMRFCWRRSAVAPYPSFFEQPTPFPHISFLHLPSPYTSAICLSISAEWTFLACEYPIISRTSQVAGFPIFVFLLNDYSERRKSWHRNTQYMCYPCHTEDEWSL